MFRYIAAMLGLTLITACAPLDRFSNKATDFNIQAADVQDRTMLLNIIRAANRYPMHFTELSTLSGTQTASVGGTLTLPFAVLNGGNSVFSAAPTGTLTDTPTFNIAVLETQEFYKGMLAPISENQLANYVDEGLQRELIFALSFGEILYQPVAAAPTATVENNFHRLKSDNAPLCVGGFHYQATDDAGRKKEREAATEGRSEYSCFKDILRALVEKGLTLEQTKEIKNWGPPLPESAFADPKWLNGLDTKTIKIIPLMEADCIQKKDTCPEGLEGLPPKRRDELKEHQQLFRIQTQSSDYRYCFDLAPNASSSTTVTRPEETRDFDVPAKIKRASIDRKLICRKRLPANDKPEKLDSPGAHSALHLTDPERGNEEFVVQVQPRSTEGIIYFLGEIARCNLALDPLSVCNTLPTVFVDYRKPPQSSEDVLFAVSTKKLKQAPAQGEPASSNAATHLIAVDWSGERYTVNVDASAVDRSGQVLRIVTQLLALNRSAKDFPAPAVVPIISR